MGLQIDKFGKVWALTKAEYFGINYFDGTKWHQIPNHFTIPDLFDYRSYVFQVDYIENNLFIAVAHVENGLFIYSKGRWTYFNDKKGLPTNRIFSLVIDQKKVWLGTEKGVYFYENGTIHKSTNIP